MELTSYIWFVCFLSGLAFLLLHGICVHKIGDYLKQHHPVTWKELETKKIMGISQEIMESRNYFSEIKFYLTDNTLSDTVYIRLMKKVRLFLIIGTALILFSFCLFFLLL
jgi:hypothetical protein